MITNKSNYTPEYFVNWSIFIKAFPPEADFVIESFQNLCKGTDKIYGSIAIKNLLSKELLTKFPDLITRFEKVFSVGIDAVLGIGLWITIDSDNEEWFWSESIDQEGFFRSKIYAKK